MNRAAFLTFRWLLLFAASGAGWLLTSRGTFGDRLPSAAAFGALNATLWPLTQRLANRIRQRRRPPGAVCEAQWRTYDGGRRAHWRNGWLVASGTGLQGVPVAGAPAPPIEPAAVTAVSDRAPTRREAWWIGEQRRIVEVLVGDTRHELAVPPDDVAAVRARLAGG